MIKVVGNSPFSSSSFTLLSCLLLWYQISVISAFSTRATTRTSHPAAAAAFVSATRSPAAVAAAAATSFSRRHHPPSSTLLSVAMSPSELATTTATTTTTSTTTTSSSSSKEETMQKKNKFRSEVYDKPILLVGYSSHGNELNRLAQSLYQHMNNNNNDSAAGIIPLTTSSSSSTSSLETLQTQIASKQLTTRSNVLVMDLSSINTSNNNDDDSQVDEDTMMEWLSALYQETGLLSILVNVHDSQLSETALASKQKWEEKALVPFTDYEICIKDEGTKTDANNNDDNDDNDNDAAWSHVEWELSRLVARAMLPPATVGENNKATNTVNNPYLTMGLHSFFLSLSFPSIEQVQPYVEEMCQDVDAMEYRTDLLTETRDSRFEMIYGQQLVRKYCRPHAVRAPGLPSFGTIIGDSIPIVYTVRTEHQAGTYPDDVQEGIPHMFRMLEWGLRSGADVVDVESAWNSDWTRQLLDLAQERYSSLILGSHHVVGEEVSREEAVKLFQQCALDGRAHGAKVVLSVQEEEKSRMAYEASLIADTLELQQQQQQNEEEEAAKSSSSSSSSSSFALIPKISLVLGEVGRYSRIVNPRFTPVTHESLPFKAAPGQMTANECLAARLLTGILKSKNYAILGHNIDYTVSPAMHGAAFAAVRLPHEYYKVDVATVEELIESDLWQGEDFGGMSVTIPHKQAIIPYVDVMSEAAKEIGSVNTIVVKEKMGGEFMEREIHGDNTDWRGIFNPIQRRMGASATSSSTSSSSSSSSSKNDEAAAAAAAIIKKPCALILGAGGTARAAAYAAKKLGLELIFYNRTPAKAEELVKSFGGTVISSLDQENKDNGDGKNDNDNDSLGSTLNKMNGVVRVVISTLPAAAGFVLPEWMLSSSSDNNNAATEMTTTTKPIVFDVNYKPYHTKLLTQAQEAGCPLVRGSEMLWEQGVGQFELWMERTAPYKVMKDVVLDNCIPKEDNDDDDKDK